MSSGDLKALADRLEAANRWRRGNGEQQPDPTALSADIDAAVAELRQVSELRTASGLEPERDAVLAQLDDATNQTWRGKRARWASFVRAQDAEIQRLQKALTLAANRMDVMANDYDKGTTARDIADEWADETRAAVGPNVLVSG